MMSSMTIKTFNETEKSFKKRYQSQKMYLLSVTIPLSLKDKREKLLLNNSKQRDLRTKG